jgi:hypothetical protein
MPFRYSPTVIKFLKRKEEQNAIRDPRFPFGEAIHKKHFINVPYTFKAQNFYRRKDERENTYVGDAENSIGRLCVSKKDFDRIPQEERIEKGDKIVEISGIPVYGYKVVEIRPTGHIGLWSGIQGASEHSLYLIFYEGDKETKPSDMVGV